MLAIHESSADRAHRQGADFEGSLELLRELAVTTDVEHALPRLSAIVGKMLPHDALRLACFDERGRLVVNASTADVPDVTASEMDEVIIDDLEAGPAGASAGRDATDTLGEDDYRSALGVSTSSPEPLVSLVFWSKRPLAFNRAQMPLARWIAYHFGLGASGRDLGRAIRPSDAEPARRVDAGVPRGLERVPSGLRVVGESAEWREVLRKATQVASTDTTVLITGESGTGKEVVARFIHAASARKDGPFVALNCAALPEQLLESELFGHERGAFTGAHQAKPGHLELAAGGVLFLDEVGEMSKAAQAKLLRVLQEREFQRVGGTRTLKADIRVVAATNRDLRKAVQQRRVPRGLALSPRGIRHPHPAAARAPRGHRAAHGRAPEGHRRRVSAAGAGPDAGRPRRAAAARLARERARAAQRARTRDHPGRRRADSGGSPRAARRRRPSVRR